MPQIYTINPNTQHKKRLTSTKDGQASLIYVTMYLLFPDKYINRRTGKIPVLAYLVLKETFVRVLDPLRQVTEEHERRHAARRELGDIFDLDILTLPCWGRIILDDRKHHLVQLGRRDTLGAILVNLLGGLQHLQDTLFRQSGDKQDREVGKRSQTRIAVVYESITFWLLSSIKSHLFTQTTNPFLFFCTSEKIFISWLSIPLVASNISTQTSEFSMARIERITE